MKLSLKDIQDSLFSPGNIYWDRSGGKRSLITKKGDAINYALINKLDEADHLIFIEDSEIKLHREMHDLFLQYNSALLMKDKINFREQIIALLREEFIEHKKSQDEFNLLAWKLFSLFTQDETDNLTFQDHALLHRHLSVASSYVFCAFFLGYYETKFLKNLFTNTLRDLMKLGDNVASLSLKERLEFLRIQNTFNDDTKELVAQMAESSTAASTMFLERYDGSGIRKLNFREMSDLEILLVSLNQFYGFKRDEEGLTNILRDIEIGDLRCETKMLKMLQRVLYKKPKNILAAIV